jgi:NAD(P)-dependent dehydrogenase (short-subunit alcohol dehydrogenase family)
VNTPTALVTGANKGIGKEIARQLAAAGLIVYVGSRDAGRGRRTVDEIGGNARLLLLDVTNDKSVADAAQQVAHLDILVNNAGIMVDGKPAIEADVDSFRRTYETNLFGVVAVTNAFLPALRRSAKPRIVNISTGTGSLTWSTCPEPQFPATGSGAAYRSSKTALNALTVFYAQALAGDGFKVNALAPGLRATDLTARATASDGDAAPPASFFHGTAPPCRGRSLPGRTGTPEWWSCRQLRRCDRSARVGALAMLLRGWLACPLARHVCPPPHSQNGWPGSAKHQGS